MVWFLFALIIIGFVVWEMDRRSSRKKQKQLTEMKLALPSTKIDQPKLTEEKPWVSSPPSSLITSNETGLEARLKSGLAPVTAEAEDEENKPNEYAFIDLETTGLDPQSDRIIEVGVFIAKIGVKTYKGYSELVNPERKLPARIVELTGITDEMLYDAKKACEVLPEFFDYIGDRTVFAYNAVFDIGFLKAEAKRLGREFNNPSHCIMEDIKTEFPQLPRYSLDSVCKAFDITTEQASHRALGDAERAMRVFFAAASGNQPTISSGPSGYGYANTDNIYYVYGHYNSSGKLFYVGVGNGDRAWSKDLSPIWKWYVDKTLGGEFTVKLIRENMRGWEAGEYKDSLLKLHSETLLNRQNSHRETDYSQLTKFHALRDANRNQIKKAISLEKTNPETAISLLMNSIDRLDEYAFMKLEGGFFGHVIADMVQEQGSKGELEALDRLTLLLCKQGQGLEARKATDHYFAKFKADEQLKKAEAIHKRVNKAVIKKVAL